MTTLATVYRRGDLLGRPYMTTIVGLLLLFLALVIPAYAQESGGRQVTADEVNAIARKLYCPVCENQPLDTCATAACEQWRGEIRTMLEQGETPQAIIDHFVARYGERVVGVPQDPTLNTLSLATPWIIGAIVLAAAVYVLLRLRRSRPAAQPVAEPVAGNPGLTDDEYRARLERDLLARR